MSDAILAVGLGQCQLGDREFVVQLELDNERRLNMLSAFHPKTALFVHDPQDCKTLIVDTQSGGDGVGKSSKAPLVEEELLQILTNKNINHRLSSMIKCVGGQGLLIEFGDRETMLSAIKAFVEKGIKALEVTQTINPDARKNELENVMLYGVPMSKLLEVTERNDTDKRTTSRKREVSRERDDGDRRREKYSRDDRRGSRDDRHRYEESRYRHDSRASRHQQSYPSSRHYQNRSRSPPRSSRR